MKHVINQIRQQNPLIHTITNMVVANFSANGLLAIGASPVMADAVEEAADMAKVANAVVLNMGTLSSTSVEAMILAGKSANEHHIPVILDPVAVGATSFRTTVGQRLVSSLKIDLIRGNAAEIANLIGEKWEIKGVDAGNGNGDTIELAIKAASMLQTVIVMTGEKDIISDGSMTYIVHNGHPILTKVTGTGCLLSAVVGAFAAVEKNFVQAAVSATVFYGVAAEIAAEKVVHHGTGSFQIEFLNQLSLISSEDIKRFARFEQR